RMFGRFGAAFVATAQMKRIRAAIRLMGHGV
ncbi:MAG: hypothetical protein ACI9OD_005310, partial [Limisphaerales bacterium]